MLEKKVGEENLIKNEASGGGGGIDDQISSLEDQLQRAQSTLLQLQTLKEKLEEEKNFKQKQAADEKERQLALKLKEENTKLKDDLKNYYKEISSLKGVISSLKDDLSQSAQLFQSKVVNSLKILEEAEIEVEKKAPKDLAKMVAQAKINFEADEKAEEKAREIESGIDARDVIKAAKEVEAETAEEVVIIPENIVEPQVEAIESKEAIIPEAKVEAPTEVSIPETIAEEPAAIPTQETTESEKESEVIAEAAEVKNDEPVGAATDIVAEAKTESIEAEAPAEIAKIDEPKITEEIKAEEAPIEELKTDNEPGPIAETLTEEKIVEAAQEDELLEYEKIRKELESIANGSIFLPSETDNAEPDDNKNDDDNKKPEPPDEPKNDATDSKPTDTPTETEESSEEPKKNFWSEPKKDTDGKTEEAPKKRGLGKFFSSILKKNKKKTKLKAEKETPDSSSKAIVSEKQAEKANLGKLAIKTTVFVVIIAGSIIGYKLNNANKLRETYIAQAKNVYANNAQNSAGDTTPDEFKSKSTESKYKEAYIDMPFADTVWDNMSNPSFGIKLSYPRSTSYKFQSVDGNSVIFLRKDGYLMKIEKIAFAAPLDQYITNSFKTNVGYMTEITTIKKTPAVLLTQNEQLAVNGNIYLYKPDNNTIIKIWYKTFAKDEDRDDKQRVAKMLDSIEISPIK